MHEAAWSCARGQTEGGQECAKGMMGMDLSDGATRSVAVARLCTTPVFLL